MNRRSGLIAAAVAVIGWPLMVIVLFLAVAGGPGLSVTAQTGPAGPVSGGASAKANERIAENMLAGYGWQSQDGCLDKLWTRESGWSNTAKNAASGAYGISQALGHAPGENSGALTPAELAENRAGDNYPQAEAAANPPPWGTSDPAAQIKWGLGYIQSTYGSPCAAWAHETQAGWY